MYVRFERIASIPTTAFIYNATMYLDHYPTASYQTAVNNTLDVYDAGSFGWTSYMTWNTQKDYAFTNRVTSRVSDKSQSRKLQYHVAGPGMVPDDRSRQQPGHQAAHARHRQNKPHLLLQQRRRPVQPEQTPARYHRILYGKPDRRY